jgi:HSP20 family molecular chaperone IbpA
MQISKRNDLCFSDPRSEALNGPEKETHVMTDLTPAREHKPEVARMAGPILLPYSPLSLGGLGDELGRLFERFAGEWSSPIGGPGDSRRWGLDVQEGEGAVVVRAEAPGFEANYFDLRLSDGRLVLRASRKTEGSEGEAQGRSERESYSSVSLPSPRSTRPVPRGRSVGSHAPPSAGFPVLSGLSVCPHAVVITSVEPLVRFGSRSVSLIPPAAAAFPE